MSKFTLPFLTKHNDKRILYKNADILDPETGYRENGCLLTIGDKISDFGKHIDPSSCTVDEIIDCRGLLITPGLIDIQVHFRSPGQEEKETIATGSRSAAAGGITTVVCQPNTIPRIDNEYVLSYLKQKTIDEGYINILCYAAITNNLDGINLTEMETLASYDNVVGFTDDGLPVMNSLIMRRALEFSRKLGLPIAQHAEDINLSNGGCINEGKVSESLGVRGIPNHSESIIVERDIQLTELTGGKYHVLHASAKETVDAVRRAKSRGINVTCEVSPHHLTLTDKEVLKQGAVAKMNPPLRSEEDRQSLLEALKDGTIDCIATDHAPHEEKAKNQPLDSAAFGIVGLETMLPISLELYHNGFMDLKTIISKLTYLPANIISSPNLGRIKKGCPANLTIIDLNEEWIVDSKKLHSLSQNTPFNERKVKGKAKMTVINGIIVYNDL